MFQLIQRSAMQRGAVLLILSAALFALPVSAARADPPHHVSFPVSYSYAEEELAAVCGFDVTFSLSGTFAGVIFHNKSGDIDRELNVQPGTKITFSSATTGHSAFRSRRCST